MSDNHKISGNVEICHSVTYSSHGRDRDEDFYLKVDDKVVANLTEEQAVKIYVNILQEDELVYRVGGNSLIPFPKFLVPYGSYNYFIKEEAEERLKGDLTQKIISLKCSQHYELARLENILNGI